jgi:Tfp pilus assembly protein PilO
MKSVLKSILVIFVIVGSWVGAYELVFKEQLHERVILVQKMREQACVLDEIKKLSEDGTPERYEAVLSPALEALIAKAPSSPDIPELITELTQLAKKTKTELVSYETAQDAGNVHAEIRVAGRVKQVFEFLGGLSSLERLVLVDRLNYENRTAEIWLKAPEGEFDLEHVLAKHMPYRCGDLAVLNLQGLEIPWKLTTIQKSPSITRSPFIEQIRHITARGLHLVGLVQQRSAWLGLVEDEHGFGQIVRVGDKLPNGFQVTEISRQGLSLVSGSVLQTMSWRKP